MTTQSSSFTDTNNPTRRSGSEGRSTAEILGSAGSELKTKADDLLEQGKGRMSRLYEGSKERVTEWKGGFQEGIREKPIQSVLIAVAVGAVIGMLIGRRSS